MTKEKPSHKSQVMRVMSSSKDMTWGTPQQWFDYLNLEFKFTLDPCALPETAKCKKYFTPKEDGLKQGWQNERVFMNPPYGQALPLWAAKGEVRFPIGRLTFDGSGGGSAPYPVAIVIFRPR